VVVLDVPVDDPGEVDLAPPLTGCDQIMLVIHRYRYTPITCTHLNPQMTAPYQLTMYPGVYVYISGIQLQMSSCFVSYLEKDFHCCKYYLEICLIGLAR
jgi:hypothetical protein